MRSIWGNNNNTLPYQLTSFTQIIDQKINDIYLRLLIYFSFHYNPFRDRGLKYMCPAYIQSRIAVRVNDTVRNGRSLKF